jgi:hypothetical protein
LLSLAPTRPLRHCVLKMQALFTSMLDYRESTADTTNRVHGMVHNKM